MKFRTSILLPVHDRIIRQMIRTAFIRISFLNEDRKQWYSYHLPQLRDIQIINGISMHLLLLSQRKLHILSHPQKVIQWYLSQPKKMA